jgi:glycosyltransferase involved in cell wall biosynthesis
MRILRKAGWRLPEIKDRLHMTLKKEKPDIVIISQGNNTEGGRLMKDCINHRTPFITITHLAMQESWPGLNDQMIDELRTLYGLSRRNYFVSLATQRMSEKLLGENTPRAMLIYNPFTKQIPANVAFPPLKDGIYKIALIGRIETYHKGYDLLIEVLKKSKWKERPVEFSIFGKGPHTELLQRSIKQNDIKNLHLQGHQEDIGEIWKTHHLLLMPSRMEGQSLTLIEAMRFRRTAVVTNVGGATELIKEGVNGFIAEYPIQEAIDAALERAWQQRTNWEQLGIKAEKTILEKHPADALDCFFQQVNDLVSIL